jgi:hypothetical protein
MGDEISARRINDILGWLLLRGSKRAMLVPEWKL